MQTAAAFLLVTLLCPAGVLAEPSAATSPHDLARIRAKLAAVPEPRLAVSSRSVGTIRLSSRRASGGDRVWDGLLIGAGIGFAGGLLWGKQMCPNDGECFAIAGPMGSLIGAGIGAAVGAIADALH